MRIWIVNHYAIPPTQPGGTRHYALAKQLIDRGHEVIIIASNLNYQTRCQITQGKQGNYVTEIYDGVPFCWIPTPEYNSNSPARVWNMLSFALQVIYNKNLRIFDRPDVIIGSSPHPLAALAACRLADKMKVPFVMEVRDLWPQSLVDLGGLSPFNPVIGALYLVEKYLYSHAELIVSLLPGVKDYVANRGYQPSKVVWLPNGIDLSLVPQVKEKTDDKNEFIIMYAGAHGLANGLDTIIDAATIIREKMIMNNIRIVLVGDGPEKERLKARANSLGLADLVYFWEPVAKKEIYTVLEKADAFIVILKKSAVFKYGVSMNKLYDYMVMKRPIIIAVDALNNPVSEAGAGLIVPPEDPAALGEAILHLYSISSFKRIAMGDAGRKYVEKYHDIREIACRLEKVLQEVIDSFSKYTRVSKR